MNPDERPQQIQQLNSEARAAWDRNGAFWDARMGEGNQFQRVLIGPATERLLETHPGELVLDVACGNGVFARRLAALGARVVACDFSPSLLERARARATERGDRIEYRLVDATEERQLLALGEGRFDAAVCNMALMDMATIQPLMRALARLLKPDGRFVFSVMHPCFNHPRSVLGMEEEDLDGELVTTRYVKQSEYLRIPPARGLGILGQPVPHPYFHRPLGELLGACFAAGLALDALEEPGFGPEDGPDRPLGWAGFTEIPPVLVARLRPTRVQVRSGPGALE